MTLLVTVAGLGYALSTSDTRISVPVANTYVSKDENFNKHILFFSNGMTADVSFTGVARWTEAGKTVTMYDVISESLSRLVQMAHSFGNLVGQLAMDILERLEVARTNGVVKVPIIELHIVGKHQDVPHPLIAVISTFRKNSPWMYDGEFQFENHFEGISFYFKMADKPELVIGGMDTKVSTKEKKRIFRAVSAGAGAFEVSQMCSSLIEMVAKRSQAVGSRSVSVLLPEIGFVDTNLWDPSKDGLIAFLPRMIFQNGEIWGPSEFPVDLSLMIDGHLPHQSLFFKSIVASTFKKRDKQRVFRNRKGKAIPGIIGLLGLALFNKVPDGYADFNLS